MAAKSSPSSVELQNQHVVVKSKSAAGVASHEAEQTQDAAHASPITIDGEIEAQDYGIHTANGDVSVAGGGSVGDIMSAGFMTSASAQVMAISKLPV